MDNRGSDNGDSDNWGSTVYIYILVLGGINICPHDYCKIQHGYHNIIYM